MFNILRKTLRDKRSFVLGWSAGLALLGYLMLIFYPSFHQQDVFDQLAKALPPALKGLVGDLNNLKQLPSYIGSQLFEIRLPIFVSILAIILSVGLSVAEEEKGQLRTLVSLPVSRTKILFGKWGAATLICAVVSLAALMGVELGLLSIGEHLDWQVLGRLGIMTWLVATVLATIVLGVGLATGRRGPTMAVGIVVAVGSFILTTFANSVDWLQPYEKVSVLHYFPAVDIAKSHIELSDVLVYVGIIVVFLTVGWLRFRRRDIQQ